MLDIFAFIDITKRVDLVFWAIIVIGFLTFFRKSNLIPDAKDEYDPIKQLSRGAITFDDTLAILTVKWTKTIQCRQRKVQVPLFPIPGSLLCPVTLVKALMNFKGKEKHLLFAIRRGVPLHLSNVSKETQAYTG